MSIKSFFLKNIKAKIFCLIIAFVLWVFVASNQSLLGKFPNKITIKTVNLSDQYQAFLDQDSIQVTAMAEPAVWKTLTSDSFIASIDLAGYKEGTFELPINVVSSVANVQVTKVEPSKVFVNIEKIVSKTISLSAKVNGDPADGMMLGTIELSPDSIDISGPASSLEAISEANAVINLNGESGSFERSVKIVAVAENNGSLTHLKYSPEEVTAKVSITRGGNNKTVGVKVKSKGNVKEGYYISKIITTPAAVDIAGQRSVTAGINYIETEELDISTATDIISRDLNLILPDGVTLQKGTSAKIHVEVTFTENATSRAIVPSIVPENLGDGLKVVSYSPVDLKVYVSGSQAILNSLTGESVKIKIDLNGKNAGNHVINVTTDMVNVPSGVAISSIFPSSLTIVLSN